jgi:hypothetical protein
MISSDPSQKLAEAHACNQLGALYRKMNQLPQSVQYYERFYKLSVQLKKENKQTSTLVSKKKEQGTKASTGENANLIKTPDLALPNVGLASVQVGIVRGNAQMSRFFEFVNDSKRMESLMKWKEFRTFEGTGSTVTATSVGGE